VSFIRILPEILSNKIAAGEVVERPASVVKELVENSLDAGSTRIVIDVESGGRGLIRVSDNGSGMSRDDALLCIERYATSKIITEKDLFAIKTLGFRGEALPSIAAVSRFVLETRATGDETGTRLEIEGGKIRNVSEVGVPEGTMVAVRDLFFNTPARRKFMKGSGTETAYIADTLAGMALGWPQVRFSFLHNGRNVKNWPSVSDSLERAVDILGRDIHKDLRPLSFQSDTLRISGWVGLPGIERATSRGIYIFVNRRIARDRTVQHALFEGYSGRLMKGRFPVAVIFITVPEDQVDVNVHPAKSEVRFVCQKTVHEAVIKAVSDALARNPDPRWAGPPQRLLSVPSSEKERGEEKRFGVGEPIRSYEPSEMQFHSGKGYPLEEVQAEIRPPVSDEQASLWEKRRFSDLRIIGQVHGTYILCETGNGFLLIDQHAAHERVVFEQFKHRGSSRSAQRLLIPETLDLGHVEAELMKQLIPVLKETGFEVEPFGGHTFVIHSVPELLEGKNCGPLLTEMAEKTAEIGVSLAADTRRVTDECLKLIACHGAIRAGQTLLLPEMQHLLFQLDQCLDPHHCPHGRPTWIQWDLRFLEKSFGRTG
jgi:DNA mismatch repair protein MutL